MGARVVGLLGLVRFSAHERTGIGLESGENFSLFFSLDFLPWKFSATLVLCFAVGSLALGSINWPAMYARVSLNRNPEPYPDHRIIGNSNLNSNRVSGDKILSYPYPPRSSI